MLLKFVTFACVIVLLLIDIECLRNYGHILSCWPAPVHSQNFSINAYYYSRNNSVHIGASTTIDKKFDVDPKRRTTVIVHGYMSTAYDSNIVALRMALLMWKDMNVFVIDWQAGALNPWYQQSAVNTEFVAKIVANLIFKLTKIVATPIKDWNTIHFIGFSLGAHVVGQAGARLKNKNIVIDRITGLDPAEPCFDDVGSPLRLKKTDARFVDIIHTDGAMIKSGSFGLLDPIGHVDFYVNGGTNQPGCNASYSNHQALTNHGGTTGKINDRPPKTIQELLEQIGNVALHIFSNGSCHHGRSFKIFIESIVQAVYNKCKFWAHPWRLGASTSETLLILREKCDENNCVEMGINAELYEHREGTYYIKTNDKLLFCEG